VWSLALSLMLALMLALAPALVLVLALALGAGGDAGAHLVTTLAIVAPAHLCRHVPSSTFEEPNFFAFL
jgi:hypothetical protein